VLTMACYPGPSCWAEHQQVMPGVPALVLFLDPIVLEVQLPPVPGGSQLLARFCRELSRAAAGLADVLEHDGARHRLIDPTPQDTSGGESR